MPAKRLEPRYAGQLRYVQRAGSHRYELSRELIPAVGPYDPTRPGVVPRQIRHLGVEQGVVVQAELLADALAVFEDLWPVNVLLARHVAGLLQQRQVDHGRGVALGARVAVPVPGAA